MWMRLALAAGLMMLPEMVFAQPAQPRLIREAEFGTIREIEGEKLMIATARDGCPAAMQPAGGGPCFDTIKARLTVAPVRVLGLYRPAEAGERVAGRYGSDFSLFYARMEGEQLVTERLELPTSDVTVPRDCYRLNGEDVGYVIQAENGANIAFESQIVVCGGGPAQPRGPYRPEGPPILPGSANVHHRTEMLKVWGQMRWLATTGTACDPQYVLRKTWCAQGAISHLQANPGLKELDLIAARQPVKDGDVLTKKQIDQWVLKRSGKTKFKADSRWVDKSFMGDVGGCSPVQDIGWHVHAQPEGLFITEGALNRCGAPLAPVPTRIFEAYGEDFFIVDCAERRGEWRNARQQKEGTCFDQARGYLKRNNRSSAVVVVLNERGRVDDYLYAGSYLSHDVAEVRLNDDGTIEATRYDNYAPNVYLSNCRTHYGPAESKGFVLVRSMGVTWARAYQWMECPVY